MSAEWAIEGESDGQYIHGDFNGANVYVQVEVSAIGTPPTFREHVEIEQAPLHLIAAAPLMLEALEALCALECFMVPTEPSIQKVLRRGRQALAAAHTFERLIVPAPDCFQVQGKYLKEGDVVTAGPDEGKTVEWVATGSRGVVVVGFVGQKDPAICGKSFILQVEREAQ